MVYSTFRGPTSPRDEHSFTSTAAVPYPTNPLSPPRTSNRLSGGMMSSAAEQRVGLQRRFTTNALPSLSPIGQQRLQAAGEIKQQTNRYSTLPPSEQKSRFYESLLAEQRRIQAFIEQIDPETRREVDENLRHEHAVSQMIAQSEPTTPPDYGDAFPSAFSRPNRYSTTSMTSAPANTRQDRSSTQFTSPRMSMNHNIYNNTSTLPSQSVPGSRRHSDDEEDADDFATDYELGIQKTVLNPNRKSLPVTRHDRKQANVPDLASVLGPVNTTSYLFGDELRAKPQTSKSIHTSPQDGKTYLQVQHTADGFPKLIRREENGELTMSALDTTLAKQETQLPDRSSAARHRISLPPTSLRNNDINIAGIMGVMSGSNDRAANRHSVEARPTLKTTPPRHPSNGAAQASYSSNDVPTLKSIGPVTSPTLAHQKTPSINRGLGGSFSPRQNQDSAVASPTDSVPTTMNSPVSGLQASAPSFGPSGVNTPNESSPGYELIGSPALQSYGQHAFYGGYGMQMLNNSFGNMSFGGLQHNNGNWTSPYAQNHFNAYNWQGANGQAIAGASRYGPEHHRYNSRSHKSITEESPLSRINSVNSDDFKGEVANLCVDQHGCRFLQRKLDEHDPATTNLIYEEVRSNIVKLMIDPFGNYLCQKLLEFCTDAQRTELIKGTTSKMAEIALNQHGTRALQKMIEQINSPEQTELIVEALRYKVVMLIQDLNGNHVIQKCLNHLKAADAQFIFDAVGANCVTVGTHRHGCCVLQRCIDHAAGLQKGELVRQITTHAMTLVLDPFGNYVIQYIIDIGEPCFIEPVCQKFLGNIVQLARQKFSSNVVEKCIRSSGKDTKDLMIKEISSPAILESMLRDGYGNYVIQTAVDYASDDVKSTLVNNLRPLVMPIRNSPPGRRLLQKIAEWDGKYSNVPPTTELLNTGMQPQTSQGILAAHGAYGPTNGARSHRMGFVSAPAGWSLNGKSHGNMAPATSGIGQSFNVTAGPQHPANGFASGVNGQHMQHMQVNNAAFASGQHTDGQRSGPSNYQFF